LAAGVDREGRPLDAAGRRLAGDLISDADGVVDDLAQASIVPPSLTFEHTLSVFLGRREVRVMHLGRGNTAGDAVVYVPDAKVLATGDLVVRPSPYAYDAYMSEWLVVMKRLMAIDAAVIVPGHGAVMHDFAYVRTVAEMVESVITQVHDAGKDGATLEQVRAKVDLERYRKLLAGDDAYQNLVFRTAFAEPAVKRAYEEQTGALHDE
jgi:glyoxylase-like metal-dependent hydrolase (beta-lactamase superfamily II)